MSEQFMSTLQRMMDEIMDHVRQEESTFFAALRDNFSSQQLEQIATEFKAKKSEVQRQAAKM